MQVAGGETILQTNVEAHLNSKQIHIMPMTAIKIVSIATRTTTLASYSLVLIQVSTSRRLLFIPFKNG